MKLATVFATVAATAFGVATLASTPTWAQTVTQTSEKTSVAPDTRPPSGMLPGATDATPDVAMGPAKQVSNKTPGTGRSRR